MKALKFIIIFIIMSITIYFFTTYKFNMLYNIQNEVLTKEGVIIEKAIIDSAIKITTGV